ncbi:unnamed protein product [Bursaphelenchus xylophilus]|uniref:(pine wood nematode) hypothetical protein n=1 Tax=Bursaphelenchus xylophilus TaxID=6326 RepID=A0A1I7RPW1_BURXY|nr:unnamed protein product [Bursaphelenchus xylophilus]CAG9096709.1 unnamed protein product [Bursaphelenchus xylophilus]
MGNQKKPKVAGNVIKSKTFAKRKIKVGKTLKKTNATDSSFTTKSVVILKQFADSTTEPVSHRGLTLKDLNTQIGHSGFNFRKDAVLGMKQLLADNPELIVNHLYDIVSSVGRLLIDDNFASNKAASGNLRALFKLLFSVPEKAMSTPFPILKSHIRISLTHKKLPVRIFGLSILNMMMESYPGLCRQSLDLRESFLSLMQSQKRPSDTILVSNSISLFKSVYETPEQRKTIVRTDEMQLSISQLTLTKLSTTLPDFDRFRFSVFDSDYEKVKNPIDSSFLEDILGQ